MTTFKKLPMTSPKSPATIASKPEPPLRGNRSAGGWTSCRPVPASRESRSESHGKAKFPRRRSVPGRFEPALHPREIPRRKANASVYPPDKRTRTPPGGQTGRSPRRVSGASLLPETAQRFADRSSPAAENKNPTHHSPGGEAPGGEAPGCEGPGCETPRGETSGGEARGGEAPGGSHGICVPHFGWNARYLHVPMFPLSAG